MFLGCETCRNRHTFVLQAAPMRLHDSLKIGHHDVRAADLVGQKREVPTQDWDRHPAAQGTAGGGLRHRHSDVGDDLPPIRHRDDILQLCWDRNLRFLSSELGSEGSLFTATGLVKPSVCSGIY